MKVSISSVAIALLAVGHVAATPLPAENSTLIDSDIKSRAPGDWQCGNQQTPYDAARVDAAYTELENRWVNGPYLAGANNGKLYPAYYGNKQDTPPGPVQYDNPNCNNNPSLVDFQEFPVPRNGQPFRNNGRPGPDRVVIGRLSPGTDTIRCGLMTHSGAGGQNQFVPCTPLP